MSERLIVISNRMPTEGTPAGGLVFALHEALCQEGGIWIGAGEPSDAAVSEKAELKLVGSEPYTRMSFPISKDEHEGFYLGHANSVIWPLFHRRADLIRMEEGDAESYMAVNRRVARLVAAQVRPGDLIWIHDYHFLPLAESLRALGVTNRIGFFLHIPFPHATDVMALPEAKELPRWLAAHDLVGLQTQRDVAAALELMRQDPASEFLLDGSISRRERRFRILSFPIGIDAEALRAKAEASDVGARLRLAPDEPLILGVDRLDYSKGLVHRTEAFGSYLDRRTPDGPKPTYLQIAPVSRGDVPAYRDVRKELEAAAASINGAHADLDWTPMRYVRRNVDREVVAGLYRRADVGFVTPLADGMNLVAKEFIAAQDPEDPGVLILSHFAGAAEQLTEALLVNPYDTGAMGEALETALEMPLAERKRRYEALAPGVFEKDIGWWRKTFISQLRRIPMAESKVRSAPTAT